MNPPIPARDNVGYSGTLVGQHNSFTIGSHNGLHREVQVSKYTPSPWYLFVWDKSKPKVLTIGGRKLNGDRDHLVSIDAYDEETRANARLMAAAPEMLEALKRARHRIEKMQSEGYPQDSTLNLINAAIAKAEE